MTSHYRAFLARRPDAPDPWSLVEAWWRSRTGDVRSAPEPSLTWGPLSLTYGKHVGDAGTVVEITVTDDETGVTTSLVEWWEPSGRTVILEESLKGIHELNSPLPEPSPLVHAVVDAVLTERPEQARPGQVLLVGGLERFAGFRPHLEVRTRGMLSWRVAAVEFAAERAGEPVSEGAIVYLPADAGKPVVLPAMWLRGHPEQGARRLQREVVRAMTLEELPPGLSTALRALRQVGWGADDWADIAQELDAQRVSLEEQLFEALVQQDAALRELDEIQRRLLFLECEFRNRGEIVPDAVEEDPLPVDVTLSVSALKYAADYLPGLVVSPHAGEKCDVLDAQHSSTITARRAWRALRALNDYVECKMDHRFVGSFLQYCSEAPAGCVAFPPDDVALTESEGCLANPVTRGARVFAVPKEVDRSGLVLMAAHIKVAGVGNLSARLHFYDDTSGPTRKVYVGYLGPHLPLP